MSVETDLHTRSENKCELCAATNDLNIYEVPPSSDASSDQSVFVCATCKNQLDDPSSVDVNHWRCLSDSMWTQVPAVQVVAWRMLQRLGAEGWAQDLLDMLYLDDETKAWAEATGNNIGDDEMIHVDSNGAKLAAGDAVTLIKDLVVKGAGFTAKRGTAVRNISLSLTNAGHIEGRVNGQLIVILTEFVKKSG